MPTLAEMMVAQADPNVQRKSLPGLLGPAPMPTNNAWKAEFMRLTGKNPDEVGATHNDYMRLMMQKGNAPVPMPGNWSGGVRG